MKKLRNTIGLIVILIITSLFLISCKAKTGGGGNGATPANVDLKGPPPGTDYNLTILHTNDIHGSIRPFGRYDMGGLARHAWLHREIKAANELNGANTLILDAGDVRDGSTFNDGTSTAGLWGVMNAIGYDATEIGNHDHLFGMNTLFSNLATAFGDELITDQFGRTTALQGMKVLWGNVNPARVDECHDLLPDGSPKFVYVSEVVKDSIENAFVPPIGDPCDPASYPEIIDPTLMGPPDDPTTYLFHQAVFYDYGDIRVGLFGVTTDESIYTVVPGAPMDLEGYLLPAGVESEGAVFYSPDPTKSSSPDKTTGYLTNPSRNTLAPTNSYVNQMIDYLSDPNGDEDLSDGANIIICLSHAGVDTDEIIAEMAQGIRFPDRHVDVVVGGHSHTLLNRALEFAHDDGKKSWVVQADWGGIYLGRIDLDVHGTTVNLVDSSLIPVGPNVPEIKAVKDLINHIYKMPDGVNDWFKEVYGVLPTDPVGRTEVDLNYTNFLGETPLTNLLADAFYWRGHDSSIFTIPDNGNPEAGQPGFVDFSIVVPFVLHGEETILKGPLTVENMLDTLHIHDLTTDPTHSDTIHILELAPLPAGGINFMGVHFDSQVELLLEIIYGLTDLLSKFPGGEVYSAVISEYLGTLQYKGISFVVDFSRDPFDRIDPNAIKINGQPLELDRYYYFSINSTIARFIGTIGALLSDVGGIDFMNWDESWSETWVPEWVALMDYVEGVLPAATITPELVAVKGAGLRTVQPDLTLQPWDIIFTPAEPVAGETVNIKALILNTGDTAVVAASVEYTYDPTPTKLDDDPDGYTDTITGFSLVTIGSDLIQNVPGFTTLPGSALTNGLDWTVPLDLAPGEYFICPTIKLIDPPAIDEIMTGNNGGTGLCASLMVR